jgi:hypothetical protein
MTCVTRQIIIKEVCSNRSSATLLKRTFDCNRNGQATDKLCTEEFHHL